MCDRNKERTNDALQSSERDLAYGQDPRSFGEGGQAAQRAFEPDHKDAPDRDPARDPSVPEFRNLEEAER
jgi:hypothetical protein